MNFTRRELVGGLTLAGTAGLLGVRPATATAEPPPETTRVRFVLPGGTCQAPKWIAEELLRAEGFTDVQYTHKDISFPARIKAVGSGETDFDLLLRTRLDHWS